MRGKRQSLYSRDLLVAHERAAFKFRAGVHFAALIPRSLLPRVRDRVRRAELAGLARGETRRVIPLLCFISAELHRGRLGPLSEDIRLSITRVSFIGGIHGGIVRVTRFVAGLL